MLAVARYEQKVVKSRSKTSYVVENRCKRTVYRCVRVCLIIGMESEKAQMSLKL